MRNGRDTWRWDLHSSTLVGRIVISISHHVNFFCLGLQDETDAIMAALKAIEHEGVSNQAQVLVDMCAYAGTGNVLRVQRLTHLCGEHIVPREKEADENKDKEKDDGAEEEPAKDDTFQAFAVIGITLVAMGEDVGAEMCMRQLNHLVSIARLFYMSIMI